MNNRGYLIELQVNKVIQWSLLMNAFEKVIITKLRCAIFLAIFILLGGTSVYGGANPQESSKLQQTVRKVEGTVTDSSGEPLIGVSVAVKGTTTGTVTDIDGKYSLVLPNDVTAIEFSYIGYKIQTVAPNKSIINIVMNENDVMMDEVVVVGYGIQKKENLTGAVASINIAKTIDSRPVTDIGRALQGAVPGLTITTGSGELGEAPSIKIRGGNASPNSQNSGKALILLDNVEVADITMINPDDIESISVLKDAASASIYGARGANGVLLITSKSKKKNESVRVSYSTNFSWRTPTRKAKQLPGWQQAMINLQAVENYSGAKEYAVVGNIKVNETVVQKMKEWEETYGGQNLGREMEYGRDFEIDNAGQYYYRTWDWYDEFIRDWSPQQTHNINISGGGAKTNYNIGLGYVDQEGLMKVNTDKFSRYNVSMSINTEVNKWMTLRANVMYTKRDKSQPYVYNTSGLYDYMYYLYRWQPMYPYGTFEGKEFRSAMTDLNQATTNRDKKDFWRLGGGATFNITKGLTFDVDVVYNTIEGRSKMYGNELYGYDIFSAITSLDGLRDSYKDYTNKAYKNLEQTTSKTQTLTTNAYATYQLRLKENHSFKFMLGANLEDSEYIYSVATRNNIFSPTHPELDLGYGKQMVRSKHTNWAVAGFFGRVNYDYKSKYLLELNGRYDGSSKFPEGDRFKFFTSVSAGYRITEEKFMDALKPILSDLKIRGSYGEIGSQDVSPSEFLPTLTATSNYAWMTNGNYNTSFATPLLFNNSLTWEKVVNFDIGIDARFFDNKVGLTFDYYTKYTKDVLSSGEKLPLSLGGASPKVNFGELETPGWELAIDFNHRFSNGLGIQLGAQISDYKTKVSKWSSDVATIPAYGNGGDGWFGNANVYRKGMVLGDIWGYKVDRLFQEADFNADGTLKDGIPDHSKIYGATVIKPGYVKYKDLDGDKIIGYGNGETSDPGDKSVIGNIFPRYEYGFTIGADFKGFDFKMFFQGVGKRHIWAAGNQVLPGLTMGEPYFKGAEDYWTPENTNAFYPRPFSYNQGMNKSYEINDRYLLDMSYLRCKTLTLGYTIPRDIVKKARIANLRVYVTAENLFEFDNVKPDIDPEIGIRTFENAAGTKQQDARNFGRSYPYQRSLSFGLQLTL